ncbi:RHS repeat-associated core domain-containing protein [Xylanibacillus composti]|uniref:RHS repeat-associated core domain-containing protein n=3 Tax=Xylanibacillus composti TaxID=1572762 RepID=UPI0028F72D1D|nr:RHS repeat-associated core domain-containing protein [Xylanibacillus composti]
MQLLPEQESLSPGPDILTLDWLAAQYQVSGDVLREQVNKGYQLTELYEVLQKNGHHADQLQEELAVLHPEVESQWEEIEASLQHIQLQAEDDQRAEKEQEYIETNERTKSSLAADSPIAEDTTWQADPILQPSVSEKARAGFSAMSADVPQLPNLAENYDQGAANRMHTSFNRAPFSISNGSEQISTLTGDLSTRVTDMTLPGRNGLSFELNRVYNSADAKYYENDAKFRVYQRKWFYPVVRLIIERVDANGIHHSSGLSPIPLVRESQYVLFQNIYWEFTPPAMFGYEYADENRLYQAAQQQMQEMAASNQTVWRGYREAYGVRLYYYMFPTGQVAEITIDHENVKAGYENQANLTFSEENRFPLGKGWSWEIPYIKTQNGKRYLSLADAGTYEISSGNQLIGYPWKDLTLSTNNTVTVNGKRSSHVLRSIHGISHYFSSDGRLIRKADDYGNTIDFQYANVSPYGEVLTKVTDILQNEISITYSREQVKIKSGDREVIYHKSMAAGNKEFLSAVTDAEGRDTVYQYRLEYNDFNLLGSGFEDGNNYVLLLTRIYHPTGARTVYTYSSYRQRIGEKASEVKWYVTSREDFVDYTDGTQENGNRVTFTRSGFPGSTYGVDTTFTTTVNNGLTSVTYHYKKDHIDENTPAVFYTTRIVETGGGTTRTITQEYDEVRRLPVPNKSTTQYTRGTSQSQQITSSATYDDYGNILTSTDPLRTIQYTYDTTTRLLKSVREPINANQAKFTVYDRNPQGDISRMAVYENSASGTLMQEVNYGRDAHGNITRVTIRGDARNTVMNYEYGTQYNRGYPTKQTVSVVQANGTSRTITQTMEYNKLTGQLTKFVDGNGNPTSFKYDKLGRVTEQMMPDQSKLSVEYDDIGNAVTVTDMTNHVTEYYYNPFGWLRFETLGLGYASYGYDVYGRQIWSEDAKRNRTQYQYDNWGRLTRMTHADGSFSLVQYDDTAFRTTRIDEEGKQLREIYDLMGRLIRTEEITSTGTKILSSRTYDLAGNLTGVTDAAGNTTTYTYDVVGRLIAVQDAEGRTTRYRYSMSNDLREIQYPDNKIRTMQYDELGRRIKSVNPQGLVEEYVYDDNGNLIRFVDHKSQATQYSYNSRNFLLSSRVGTDIVSYTYDAGGKRLSMTDSTGTTRYAYYDSTNRLAAMTYPDNTTLVFSYDVQNLTDRYILSDSRVEYHYDNRNRLSKIDIQGHGQLTGSNWQVLELGRIDISYNKDSTLAQLNYNEGAILKRYAYDGFNLSSLSYSRSDQSRIASFSYTYDSNRNISSRNENGNADQFTYDKLNRIKTSSLFNETYTYDARGNRQTLQSDLAPTIQPHAYVYDARDRLIQVTMEDGNVIQYRYNGDGLLYERSDASGTKRYYYDEQGRLFREGIVKSNGEVELTARYIYGEQGIGLLARHDAPSDSVQYYIRNGHGDVTGVVDWVGNPINQYTYDIWGNPLHSTEYLDNPFRYSGEYWDETTQLQYLRARWYDPAMGRFINEDNYEGDITNPLTLNLYTYVHNNPLIFIDPTGHKAACTSESACMQLSERIRAMQETFASNLANGSYQSIDDMVPDFAKIVAAQDGYYDELDEDEHFIYFKLAQIKLFGAEEAGFQLSQAEIATLAAGGFGLGRYISNKAVNLPSHKKINIDIDHIISGHTKNGARAIQSGTKDLFPDHMTHSQIEKAVKGAYRNSSKIQTQGERVLVQGKSNGLTIEMWVNTRSKTIETAYPIFK